MKSRFRSNAVTKEETEDTLLRAMLYEPFPGNAAVVLSRLGFLGNGLVDGLGAGLGARTFDAESGRLSLTMDDGRVVELERAAHPHIENRYAVSVQSREGVVVDRGFILIDRDSNGKDLGVTDLLDDRMAYVEAEGGTHEGQEFAEGGAEFEPGAEDEVRVEEPESVEELIETVTVEAAPEGEVQEVEDLPVLTEEHIAEETVGETEEHELPDGDSANEGDASDVEEAGRVDQKVNEQIYGEPEIAVEAEEAGLDEESEPIEEALIEAAPEVEAEPLVERVEAQMDREPEIAVEAEEAGVDEDSEAIEAHEVLADEVEPESLEAETVGSMTGAVETEQDAEAEEVATAPEPVRKVSDRERYYGPLFQALEANEAVLFGWVAETGTIQTYEHKETGRYLHLDAASGLFYDQTRTPISKSAALRHAMRPLVVEPVPEPVVEDEPVAVTAAAAPVAAPATDPVLAVAGRVKPKVEIGAHGEELGLDAFVRKADAPGERESGRDSWKSRFAGLSRALKLKRNQNGHEAGKEPAENEKS